MTKLAETIEKAHSVIATHFPHFDSPIRGKDYKIENLERDTRKALSLLYQGEIDASTAAYVIDAAVCHWTGRGTELEW